MTGANDTHGRTSQRTILVVEDSPTQALHVQSLLSEEGLNVALALEGQEGVQLARQLSPDLIILDMQLPDINGLEVCRRLKNSPETDYIPVIMFTRYDDPEVIALGLESGIVDYIPKDVFADAVLLETLRQMGLIEPSVV